MAIEGSLDVFHLPEILQMVSAQGKTGILTVQGETDIVAVSFKDGEVVAADALNQTIEDGLGQVLASQGLVSPQDFSAVAGEHEAGGRRLLDLLLERDLVSRPQLLDALRVQTYRLLVQLLRWEQGEFKFYSGDEVAFEEGFVPISVPELLVRSVEELGGDRDNQGPSLDEIYERVPGGPPVKLIGVDGDGPHTDPRAVWLPAGDQGLLASLDGRTPAGSLAGELGVGEYRALFELSLLLQGGAIRRVVPKPAPVRPVTAPAEAAPPPSTAPSTPVAARPVELYEEPELAPAVSAPGREDTAVGPAPRARSAPVAAGASGWSLAILRTVAVLAAAVMMIAVAREPRALLAPFPWNDEAGDLLLRNQRVAQSLQIDRGARTFFLLEGRYPDELAALAELGLLDRRSLVDPTGRPLAYTRGDVSYEVVPLERGAPVPELAVRDAITGDFLLDPYFLDLPEPAETRPLVLLD